RLDIQAFASIQRAAFGTASPASGSHQNTPQVAKACRIESRSATYVRRGIPGQTRIHRTVCASRVWCATRARWSRSKAELVPMGPAATPPQNQWVQEQLA